MQRILSSAVSAPFHADGSHLHYYLQQKSTIASKLCEELLLHDQILIPTPDFLTAVGLVMIFGERGVIELLEEGRLRFIRTQGLMCYIRGTDEDGSVLTLMFGRGPNVSDVQSAIELAVKLSGVQLYESAKLQALLEQQSINEDIRGLVAQAANAAYLDFRQSRYWKSFYAASDPGKLKLRSIKKSTSKVFNRNAKRHDPVDIVLAMTQSNLELLLAQKYECESASSFSPLGEAIGLKIDRLAKSRIDTNQIWRLFELNQIPDPSPLVINDDHVFCEFLRLTRSSKSADFRRWFHSATEQSDVDIAKEYVSVLKSIPAINAAPAKLIRFVATTIAGIHPITGALAGALDAFVVERILKGKSPRYFIEDLAKFHAKRSKDK